MLVIYIFRVILRRSADYFPK